MEEALEFIFNLIAHKIAAATHDKAALLLLWYDVNSKYRKNKHQEKGDKGFVSARAGCSTFNNITLGGLNHHEIIA